MSAGSLGHPAAGIEDRAEQQQLRAGEAVADLDRARAKCRAPARGLAGAEQQRRQAEQERGDARFTDIRSRRFRRAARRGRAAMRSATSRMIDGQREAQQVGLEPGREHRAILRADHAADEQQAGEHDVDRLGGHGVDHGRHRADRQDHHQAGADDDARRHAEQIDHRRDEDEAAADRRAARSGCRRRSPARAAPAAKCRGPRRRSASAAAAPRPSGCGAAVPSARPA